MADEKRVPTYFIGQALLDYRLDFMGLPFGSFRNFLGDSLLIKVGPIKGLIEKL